jgi:hypothetical protein
MAISDLGPMVECCFQERAPVNHARGIILQLAERDEPFSQEPLAGIGNREFLEIRKHAGLAVRGAGVNIICIGIAGLSLAQMMRTRL